MVDRRISRSGTCTLLMVMTMTAAMSGICRAQSATAVSERSGIWKAAVPPKPMQGEFNNNDPLGVAAGAMIKADCSLNWINPDDGRRYCFSSGTSLEFFLDQPQANLERARRSWRRMTAEQK
jgi:hypothetical protein